MIVVVVVVVVTPPTVVFVTADERDLDALAYFEARERDVALFVIEASEARDFDAEVGWRYEAFCMETLAYLDSKCWEVSISAESSSFARNKSVVVLLTPSV